jgi:ribosomal protein L37AE/L43A
MANATEGYFIVTKKLPSAGRVGVLYGTETEIKYFYDKNQINVDIEKCVVYNEYGDVPKHLPYYEKIWQTTGCGLWFAGFNLECAEKGFQFYRIKHGLAACKESWIHNNVVHFQQMFPSKRC